MKRAKTLSAVACLLAVSSPLSLAAVLDAPASPASMQASASPLLGTWSLDTSRLPMAPEQRPKSVSFTFADAGHGAWRTRVDIVYAPGQEVHSTSTTALDGTYASIENSPEADHVAMQRPAPNVLVMALQKDGVVVSTRIYTVLPGDHKLVETVVYPGNDSRVMRANYFDRAR